MITELVLWVILPMTMIVHCLVQSMSVDFKSYPNQKSGQLLATTISIRWRR